MQVQSPQDERRAAEPARPTSIQRRPRAKPIGTRSSAQSKIKNRKSPVVIRHEQIARRVEGDPLGPVGGRSRLVNCW